MQHGASTRQLGQTGSTALTWPQSRSGRSAACTEPELVWRHEPGFDTVCGPLGLCIAGVACMLQACPAAGCTGPMLHHLQGPPQAPRILSKTAPQSEQCHRRHCLQVWHLGGPSGAAGRCRDRASACIPGDCRGAHLARSASERPPTQGQQPCRAFIDVGKTVSLAKISCGAQIECTCTIEEDCRRASWQINFSLVL